MEKEGEAITKYFFWGIVLAVLVLSFFVIRYFITAIVTAFIIAYLLKPLHIKLSKKIPEKYSAFITIMIALLIILLILLFVFQSIVSQLSNALSEENLRIIIEGIQKIDKNHFLGEDVSSIIKEITNYLLGVVTSTAKKIPGVVIAIFVILFSTYYFLVEGDPIRKKILQLLPFKNKEFLVNKLELTIWQIVVVTLFIAIIEAVIATIVFLLLGIDYAILLGFIIGLLAFIPAIGPAAVWFPLAIVEIAYGKYFVAVVVILMGLFLSNVVDMIVRARMLGKKTAIHPIIMLIGVLGGIQLFGLIGFILGPLILSVLVTIIENIPKAE